MSDVTLTPSDEVSQQRLSAPIEGFALTLIWSREEGARLGEVALIPPSPPRMAWILGRGDAPPDAGGQRLRLMQQLPGSLLHTGPLLTRQLSRQQLEFVGEGPEQLRVRNLGRAPLRHNGELVQNALLKAGDVLEVVGLLALLVGRRALLMSPGQLEPLQPGHVFGEPDARGLVGESPALWELRRQLHFVAPRPTHVLLLGASGTGKELVAQAIHALSPRKKRPLISRNAATFPESLIDAELFGNARNYPNVGTPERPGLVGQAHASSLFLDEIGELPHSLQAHLLRVLDSGEYQRLGDATVKRAELRLIAATNRAEVEQKHDFLARFHTRLQVPDLNARLEDIPLLVRHLLRRVAREDLELGGRFLMPPTDTGSTRQGEARIAPALITALVRHRYVTHVRELEALLWQSMLTSSGEVLEFTESVARMLERCEGQGMPARAVQDKPAQVEVDPLSLAPEVVLECLERHHWVQERVRAELGLASRFVLYRLIKRYGLKASSQPAERAEGSEGE